MTIQFQREGERERDSETERQRDTEREILPTRYPMLRPIYGRKARLDVYHGRAKDFRSPVHTTTTQVRTETTAPLPPHLQRNDSWVYLVSVRIGNGSERNKGSNTNETCHRRESQDSHPRTSSSVGFPEAFPPTLSGFSPSIARTRFVSSTDMLRI